MSGPNKQLFYLIQKIYVHYNVQILCLLPEKNNYFFNDISKLKINTYTCNKFNFFFNWLKLIFLKFYTDFDIIHSYGLVPDLFCRLFVEKKKWLSVARNWPFIDYKYKFGKKLGYIFATLQLFSHKGCKNLISCSQHICNLYESYGVKSQVILNATFFNDLEIDFSKKNVSNFLFIGNMNSLKNVDLTCKLFLKLQINNSSLTLLGNGKDFKFLKNKYKDFKNINFMGHIQNVSPYLNIANFIFLLSENEGMPNSIMEGLYHGCFPLLSDIPPHNQLKGLFKDGLYICKIDRDTSDYFLDKEAIKIKSMLRNLNSTFYLQNHTIAKKVFSTTRLANDFDSIYQIIID